MEKLLSTTRPLSIGGFIVHIVWIHLLLTVLCFGAYELIGHGYHNMPLAYFVMIIGASFAFGAVVMIFTRLFAKKAS